MSRDHKKWLGIWAAIAAAGGVLIARAEGGGIDYLLLPAWFVGLALAFVFPFFKLAEWLDKSNKGSIQAPATVDMHVESQSSSGLKLESARHRPSTIVADESAVNPATGLSMMGGIGGLDIQGNAFGEDRSLFDSHSSSDFGSSLDSR